MVVNVQPKVQCGYENVRPILWDAQDKDD